MVDIAVDILGGDFAPQAVFDGVEKVLPQLQPDTQLHLVGPQQRVSDFIAQVHNSSQLHLLAAEEAVSMDEHPVKALQQKRNATINVAYQAMAAKKLDAFASAGNSGAVMVGAMNYLKTIAGISRPCVLSSFPRTDGNFNTLLDVGINVDARPELLVEFARLGDIYAREILGVAQPRVALLNTGSEAGKGSLLYQKAYELLLSNPEINFVGNLEARDFYHQQVDVTVCDGFTGNVFLKQAEGFYHMIKERGVQDEFLDKFNYENYGGSPVLGINGNVILGHGVSGASAIYNMILTTEKVARASLAEKIKKAISNE